LREQCKFYPGNTVKSTKKMAASFEEADNGGGPKRMRRRADTSLEDL
jgi:hypothetical protein